MKRKLTLSRMLGAAALVFGLGFSTAANAYVKLTAIGGSKINQGEGVEYLVDRKVGTKWGQSFDPYNPDRMDCYAILKAATPLVPSAYFLVTGGDTGAYPTRNWEDWKIYGGNFASDAEATRDAEGWVEIDSKEGVTLPQANSTPMDFTISVPQTEKYQYFRIEVLQNGQHGDVWTQMDEFGFGTYAEFLDFLENNYDDPIGYTILAGDRNNGDGEGLSKLFDNNYGTKWGNGLTERAEGEQNNGAYFIVKTSRAMAPNYYKLVTGTDNASWNHRNWKQWQIYAIAESDFEGAVPDRWSDKWVALDKKYDVTEDVLPDLNSYEVFFTLSENNSTKYKYFKVEIDKIMSGGGYMQMTEFALGDDYTFLLDRNSLVERAAGAVNMEKTFQTSIKEAYATLLAQLGQTTDIFAANEVKDQLNALVNDANKSITAYDEYNGTVTIVRNHFENHTCITDEAGKALIGKYLNEEVAPDATFKNGSYPYIWKNAQLDVAGIAAEGKYINSLLEQYAADLYEGAIVDVTYTALSSNKFDGNEGAQALVDGGYGPDAHTKWGFNGPGWIVFKCNEGEIAPTYYTLVVANDTDGNKGRQWKNWKIYGANFDSDEAATRDAQGWVLIDEKNNIGHDEFPTTNHSQTTFNMTNGGGSYQYFRVEVESNYGGGDDYTQMAELIFYNNANFMIDRREKYEEMADFLDIVDGAYWKQLKEDYQTTLQNLMMSSNGAEVNNNVVLLQSLQTQIEECVLAYEDYELQYGDLSENDFVEYTEGTTAAWAEQYFGSEAVAPCALLRNGSHAYIMTECNLSKDQINAEEKYLFNMARVTEPVIDDLTNEETTGFVYLDGHVVGQWGDGHPSNLVDANINSDNGTVNASGTPLLGTKMGGNIDTTGDTYVIFKTLNPYNPFFYTLVTANDTYDYQSRNPGSWTIYGANFEGDGEATKDAEGWVVVDEKKNIGKDRMLPNNLTASYFGFSTETTVPYQYYKIVFWGNFEGKAGAVQLQELQFGTEEQFENIKATYVDAANEFDTDVKAYKEYLEQYEELVRDSIGECVNMEVLYRINKSLEVLRGTITASNVVYTAYEDQVAEAKAFLADNHDESVDTYADFNDYINDDVEPGDRFPNGSASYILENLQVPDSTLAGDETKLLIALQGAYTAKAYIAGTEITTVFQNPSFQEFEGWVGDTLYTKGVSADGKVNAAEWCVRKGGTFNVSQTLQNMKPGLYLVDLGAAFRANRNKYSWNHQAVVYANDAQILMPVIREEIVAEEDAYLEGIADRPIYAGEADPEEGAEDEIVGYCVWGVAGSATAFENGRYRNVLIAEVGEDGLLTVGFQNIGTPNCLKGNQDDWACVGDLHVTYLGTDATSELATAALAKANACAAKRAAVLATEYADVVSWVGSVEEMNATPAYSAEVDDLLKAAATLEGLNAQKAYAAAFARIPAEKLAYAAAYAEVTKIVNKWDNYNPEEAYDLFGDLTEKRQYDVDALETAVAAMFALYPEYLAIAEDALIAGVDVAEADAFEYEILFTGERIPYAEFNGLYDAVAADRTFLAFEYKAPQDVNATIFYGSPAITGEKDAIDLPASDDWKKVCVDVTCARTYLKWGAAADHKFRMQFAGSAVEGSMQIRHIIFVTEDETEGALIISGIDGVEADAVAPILGGGIYNLAGQRVSKIQKGVYIVNGKKVLVK